MNLHPIVERLLELRGIGAEEREEFLDPSLVRLARVDALPGVREAVSVILPFVRDKRKVIVYGDYDCDSVCASAILVTALRRLGAQADAFVPTASRRVTASRPPRSGACSASILTWRSW